MEERKEGGREAWRRGKEGDLPSVGCKPSLVRAIVTGGEKQLVLLLVFSLWLDENGCGHLGNSLYGVVLKVHNSLYILLISGLL